MKSKFLIIAVIAFLVLFLVMLFSPAESSPFAPQSLYADNGISITLQGADTAGLKLSIDNQGSESIHVYGDSAVMLNDDNAAALNVSHVDDMSIRLGLTPWHGSGFSTADTLSSDIVQIIQ